MQKKCFAVLLIIFISFSIGASALTGVNNHWAGQYAVALNKMGILYGDSSGNANLGNNISRGEFLALLVRAVYSDEDMSSGRNSFVDVPYGAWYYDIASFAKKKGIVKGDDKGRLLPEDNIKREEIVLMLVRALDLKGESAEFTDVDSSYVYYNEICAAVKSGIITGYSDGSFGPSSLATRGEAAAMIARMLGVQADETALPIDTGISGKINLTWHHIYKSGVTDFGGKINRLNVISPTVFRIRSLEGEAPADYEYKLEGDNDFYLQDIANAQYINNAHANGYKVWALFKSNDFSAKGNSKFLNDESARKSAVKLIKQMILKYGLDGINMDFENMIVTDKDLYTKFVREISEVTKELGVVLSVDVTKYEPLGGTWSMCYDRKAISQYADYVALMAYDQNGVSSKTAGSVGDMPWVEKAIAKTLEEVPAEKLILGIPFYTRLWETKDRAVVKTSAIGMDTALTKISEAGASIAYDDKTGQNYAVWEADGSKFEIWLEDETSVKARIALAEKYNLAGVASWSKGFEKSSIWDVIKENLND